MMFGFFKDPAAVAFAQKLLDALPVSQNYSLFHIYLRRLPSQQRMLASRI
jgi:hypothetical protein